jgi:hypothetical protein
MPRVSASQKLIVEVSSEVLSTRYWSDIKIMVIASVLVLMRLVYLSAFPWFNTQTFLFWSMLPNVFARTKFVLFAHENILLHISMTNATSSRGLWSVWTVFVWRSIKNCHFQCRHCHVFFSAAYIIVQKIVKNWKFCASMVAFLWEFSDPWTLKLLLTVRET